MADVIYVSVLVAFFVLCVVYLKWCETIIGPDEFGPELDDAAAPYVATDRPSSDSSSAVEISAEATS